MTVYSASGALTKRLGLSKILWIEDVEADMLLAERILKKEGFVFAGKRVDTRDAFIEALESFKPDVVLSDHNLPQFNSNEAFIIFRNHGLTVPFILVTGNVSEEFAVSCLKLGMDDYVLKTNLSRLPAAILNALGHRQDEREKIIREDEVRIQNEKLAEAVRYRTQELVNEKQFSESVIKSMPGIFQVISDGHLVKWNKNMENVLGYSGDELSRMSFLDIIAPKDKAQAGEQYHKILQEGSASPELTVITQSGKEMSYYLNGFRAKIAGKDLIVITGQDITDLKRAQEALRLNKERSDLAFSSSGHAWWDWDIVAGTLTTHPNRYLALDYLLSEVTPDINWWRSLVHPEDLDYVVKSMEDYLSGKTPMYDIQYRLKSKRGEWKWFHDLGKIVTRGKQGEPLRMIGTANDISNSKLIEQELTKAKYTAEVASRTKGQFLANMSHEIRTPLNAIIGLNHLVLKTELTAKQIDYLKKIQSSSESLLGIINDILDFSKIEAGKLTLEEVNFDLGKVFQKLDDVITYKAQGKGLEIAFCIDHQTATHLMGDPVRLEQILINLCSNAVKFTEKGSIVVEAKCLEDTADGVNLQFNVKDTGIGISKKQLAKLFEPFTQAENSISRKYGGTGLGLSIIKRLIELLGGTLWVKSTPKKGSNFYFTVWFKKQHEHPKARHGSGKEEVHPAIQDKTDAHDVSVLLVEDNEINQQVASELLEGFGFTVEIANNGFEAVLKVKNSGVPSKYDLLLMDLQMPVMGGYMATKEIRKLSGYKTLPIIAMTADAMGGVREKCLEVGMTDFTTKPIDPDRLLEIVQKWSKRVPALPPSISGTSQAKGPTGPAWEGIDQVDGLRRVAGNHSLYLELLGKFMDNNKHFISDVRERFNAGEQDKGKRLIHTMKGTAGNLGMLQVYETCVTAERHLGEPSAGTFEDIMKPLSDNLDLVMNSLQRNLVPASSRTPVLPLPKARVLLASLRKLLEGHDPEARTALKNLGTIKGHESKMDQLQVSVNAYDFEEALKILDRIKIKNKKSGVQGI